MMKKIFLLVAIACLPACKEHGPHGIHVGNSMTVDSPQGFSVTYDKSQVNVVGDSSGREIRINNAPAVARTGGPESTGVINATDINVREFDGLAAYVRTVDHYGGYSSFDVKNAQALKKLRTSGDRTDGKYFYALKNGRLIKAELTGYESNNGTMLIRQVLESFEGKLNL